MTELSEAELRSQSLWKKIVIGLGVVIFVMVGVLIAAMIMRSMKKTAPDVPVVSSPGGKAIADFERDPGQLKVALPAGATVEDVRFDGGLYVVRIKLSDNDWEVWAIDAYTGERRGELALSAP